ncbi:MAG: hypothetical protein ABI539_05965 [Acidobacteriota bacterium]
MFEQELNDHESSRVKSEKGDLFYNYEVRNWDLTPRIYKILAASAIGNILFLVVFAQADLLTRRGCDSPFVGRVCQVLDTVYVGALLFGTERDYVDAEYEKIDLGDADITYIDVSNVDAPLSYPEGYFQIANPEQFAMMQQTGIDGPTNGFSIPTGPLPSNPTLGSPLINTPPVMPNPNSNPIKGNIPDSPFTVDGDDNIVAGVRKGNRGGRPINPKADNTKIDDGKTADANAGNPTVDPTDPVNPEEINRRPFTDLGNMVNGLLETKQINLESEFSLSAKGKLNKDGRLDEKTFKFGVGTSPDPKMIEVVKESIEAINESGYLQYLSQLSGKDLELLIKQDSANLSAVVQSELESENRARTISSLLNSLISYKKKQKETAAADQNDKDDLVLLEGAKVENIGKRIVITFDVPKDVALKMIQRKLAEQAAELKKENGTALARPNDNTAIK